MLRRSTGEYDQLHKGRVCVCAFIGMSVPSYMRASASVTKSRKKIKVASNAMGGESKPKQPSTLLSRHVSTYKR